VCRPRRELPRARRLQVRLRRLANAGAVERVERELNELDPLRTHMLGPGLLAYLHGHVRQVARVEPLTAAKPLESAAELKFQDPSKLRLAAGGLYSCEGDLSRALGAYERVAQLDRKHAAEARWYAAQAEATLGRAAKALEVLAMWLRSAGSMPAELFGSRIPEPKTLAYLDQVFHNLITCRYLSGAAHPLPELSLTLPSGLKEPSQLE
jgi:tetratricopeptide (TPR) repeat protein